MDISFCQPIKGPPNNQKSTLVFVITLIEIIDPVISLENKKKNLYAIQDNHITIKQIFI